MELKNIIKNSLFAKSFNLAKANPSKVGLIVLFDAMFLVSLFVIQFLFGYFAKNLSVPSAGSLVYIFIIFSLVYYMVILFAYSFFKYSILDFIKSLFIKTEFSFKRFGEFYALNIVIAGIFSLVMLIFGFILDNIKAVYQPFAFVFLATPYILFLYVIANTSHPLFYEGASIKETLKKSLGITFTKIRIYRETIMAMILFSLMLGILFLGSGYITRLIAYKNYSLYLTTYAYFRQISIIIFDLVFYLVILINRISFYAIAKEIK